MNDKNALAINQLTVNYGNVSALWDVSLEVPKGKLVGIVGPNGAGKTTLIKTALGLLKPLSGKVLFGGKTLQEVRSQIAYVPQRESVDWDFPITVRDLVVMGRYGRLGMCRRPRKADWAAVDHTLSKVGMHEYAHRQISQLSGGQQQRVFLARALLQEADIYFFDEPFAGIDIASEKAIVSILKQMQKEGKTLFVVHHDLHTVEDYFDWALLLNIRLVSCGPLAEAFTKEMINAAYGKSYALFDEALKLSQHKSAGFA